MKLPRAYGSTLLTILSLPKDARGIFSLSLRRERNPSRRRHSLRRRTAEAKLLRLHPRAYLRFAEGFGKASARGFSRRGINMPILPLITLTSAFSYFETFPRFLKPFCGNDWLVISGCALDKRIRV